MNVPISYRLYKIKQLRKCTENAHLYMQSEDRKTNAKEPQECEATLQTVQAKD